MNWNPFRRKESLARTVATIQQIGRPQSTPANYESFAKVGYGKSVIVYRCVNVIAGAARGMKYDLYNKKNPKKPVEVLKSPYLNLWNKPNPMQSTADLMENMVAFYALDGNSYLEANRGGTNGQILELWNVRPDKMKVIPGPKGYPAAYRFSNGQIFRDWPVDIVNMKSDILHWKTFHPIDDWYGMSPLESALFSLDQNLAGQKWNLSLLQNSATPSGILSVAISDANPRGELTDEQFKKLKADIEERYSGLRNAGRPMLLEGGLSWQSMSINPKDLDYQKGREVTAMDIAVAFGIAPEILGLGQKTYNNMREARLALYEETILPIMDGAMASINRWLSPAYGDNLCLDYDRDDIEILQWKRDQKYTSIASVNFLTQNEKREAVGYQPKEGWDVFVIGNTVGKVPEDFITGGASVDESDDNNSDPSADQTDQSEANPDGSDSDSDGGDSSGDGQDGTANDANDNGDQEAAKIYYEEEATEWKTLNLVNANEKRRSWRAQNARRKRLQASFDRDMREDFAELTALLKKVTGVHTDAKLTQYALLKTISDFMPTMQKTLKRHIKYSLEDFGFMVLNEGKALGLAHDQKANVKFQDYVNRYTESRSGEAIKTITQTTTKRVQKIVGEWVQTAIEDGDSIPELSKYIEAEFSELTPAMATRIARTEVAVASNNGSIEAVRSLQIEGMFKEWVTANDDRVRDGSNGGADHTAMNGAEVPLDEKFGVPPDALMDGPGDPSGSADQVINCRCVLTYRNKSKG